MELFLLYLFKPKIKFSPKHSGLSLKISTQDGVAVVFSWPDRDLSGCGDV